MAKRDGGERQQHSKVTESTEKRKKCQDQHGKEQVVHEKEKDDENRWRAVAGDEEGRRGVTQQKKERRLGAATTSGKELFEQFQIRNSARTTSLQMRITDEEEEEEAKTMGGTISCGVFLCMVSCV